METTCTVKLPPANYRRTIEELSVDIPDPALKLKFLKQALNEYQKISAPGEPDPEPADVDFRQKLLDNREKIWPGIEKAPKNLIHKDVITTSRIQKRRLKKLPYAVGSAIILLFVLWIGIVVISPVGRNHDIDTTINPTALKPKAAHQQIVVRKPVIDSRLSDEGNRPLLRNIKSAEYRNETGQILKYLQTPVLAALAPLRIQNTPPDLHAGKPSLSSQTYDSINHLPSLGVEFESLSYADETGWIPEYLRNPILLALAPQQADGLKTDQISKKSLSASHISENEKHPLPNHGDSEKSLKDATAALKYLKNPVLLALAPQRTDSPNSEQFSKNPLSASHISENEKRPLPNHGDSEKSLKDAAPALRYLKNPILLALAPQRIDSLKSEQFSKNLLSASHISENEKRPLPNHGDSEKSLKDAAPALRYLKNPILLALAPQQTDSLKIDATSKKPLSALQISENDKLSLITDAKPGNIPDKGHASTREIKSDTYRYAREQFPEYLQKPIWLVEKTPDREIYSNRLQIITTHTISNEPREYYRFPKTKGHWPSDSKITDKISGIVYHASESDVYPFMPEMNHSILKYSKQLIKYLVRKKSYHFFIDRFGRVYRLVRENHAAFHAGNSIWADDEEIYLNLNHAFIGICFEGKDFEEIKATTSKSTQLRPTGISSFNEAQLRSGKELTDWLRVKYNISQHNCVPHALISVNPDKMLIGWHLDLSRGFPFEKFGLSDKYQEPLPSMVEFGFFYDRYFEKIFNGNLWRGIHWSEEILHRGARNSGMSFAEYRKSLHQRFFSYTEWEEEMLGKKDKIEIKSQKSMGNEERLKLGKK